MSTPRLSPDALAAMPGGRPPGVPLRAPLHPGRFLERQVLQPMGISQTRAARLLGVSRRRVNELVMGHRAMSADTAIRCAMAFGISAAFWLALQAQWDCHQAWRAMSAGGTGDEPADDAEAFAPLSQALAAAVTVPPQPALLHAARHRSTPLAGALPRASAPGRALHPADGAVLQARA